VNCCRGRCVPAPPRPPRRVDGQQAFSRRTDLSTHRRWAMTHAWTVVGKVRRRSAAQRLSLGHGFEASTMDAVTATAGASKQTLYRYYQGSAWPSSPMVQACLRSPLPAGAESSVSGIRREACKRPMRRGRGIGVAVAGAWPRRTGARRARAPPDGQTDRRAVRPAERTRRPSAALASRPGLCAGWLADHTRGVSLWRVAPHRATGRSSVPARAEYTMNLKGSNCW
jgi:hypothetical protein